MGNEFKNEHGHVCELTFHRDDFISVYFPRPHGLAGQAHVYYKFVEGEWIRHYPGSSKKENGEWRDYVHFSGTGQIKRGIRSQLTDTNVTLLKLTMNGFVVLTEPFTEELYNTWIKEYHEDRLNRKREINAA